MNYGKLFDEAWALHQKMQNDAYQTACVYTRYSSYTTLSPVEARLDRLNRILGRSERRMARRLAAKRALIYSPARVELDRLALEQLRRAN